MLHPSSDDGRFTLELDGEPAGGAVAVGNGGTTGTVAVESGSHTVGESGAGGTDLSLYDIQISCLSGGGVVAEGSGARLSVPVKLRQAVVCTITNTLKAAKADVVPMLECVAFRHGAPDVAVWGYRTLRTSRSRSRPGAATASPGPAAPWPAERVRAGTADRSVPDAVRQRRHALLELGSKTVTASSTSSR